MGSGRPGDGGLFLIGAPDRRTATGGLVIGIVLALLYGDIWLVGRAIIVGILAGAVLALLPRLAGRG